MAIVYSYSAPTITVTGGDATTWANFAGMYAADVAGGWGVVTEVVASSAGVCGIYKIAANVRFGDGSTSTYFASELEAVYFNTGFYPYMASNATVRIGALAATSNIPHRQSWWRVNSSAAWIFMTTGLTNATFLLYGSNIHSAFNFWVRTGSVTMKNAQISFPLADTAGMTFDSGLAALSLTDVRFCSAYAVYMYKTPDVAINITNNNAAFAIRSAVSGGAITVTGFDTVVAGDTWYARQAAANAQLKLVNPTQNGVAYNIDPAKIYNDIATSEVWEQRTVDIHVATLAGANLGTATVTMKDVGGNTIFSVDTDANGNIAQQTVTYKKWVGTAETETAYTPFSIVISKAGYRTLTYENIAMTDKLVWHLEMPDGGAQIIGSGIIRRVA